MTADVSGETNDGLRKTFESGLSLCGFSKGDIAKSFQAQAASGPDVSHLLPQLDFHGASPNAGALPKVAASSFGRPDSLSTPKVDGLPDIKSNPFAAPRAPGDMSGAASHAPGMMGDMSGAAHGMMGDVGGAADPTGITAMVGHFMKLLEGMASFPSAEQLLDPHVAGQIAEEYAKGKA